MIYILIIMIIDYVFIFMHVSSNILCCGASNDVTTATGLGVWTASPAVANHPKKTQDVEPMLA